MNLESDDGMSENKMRATLILADAARAHPDGTFSLLRGGITELKVPKNTPALFRGSLVVRIVAPLGAGGDHTFKLDCLTEDGAPIGSEMSGSFQVPPQGGAVTLCVDMQLIFPKPGKYTFCVAVDKAPLETWLLDVREVAPEAAKG